MITLLSTVKARLGIGDFDLKDDAILTNTIRALSARFNKECDRTLARTVNAAQEFGGEETEIKLASYPVDSVSKFELKTTEAEGWLQQSNV